MGGGGGNAEKQQEAIAQQQLALQQQYTQQAQQAMQQMTSLLTPVIQQETQAQQAQTALGQQYLNQMSSLLTPIVNTEQQQQQGYYNASQQELQSANNALAVPQNYYQGIVNAANSGNYNGLVQAAGPQLGTISMQMTAAKQNILNSVPAGPGRDAMLAQLPAQQASATAGALNSAYTGALQNIAGIGQEYGQLGMEQAGLSQAQLQSLTGVASGYGSLGLSETGAAQQSLGAITGIGTNYGSIGLQETGAGLAALQGSSNTYGQVAQEQNEAKATTMGFLGSLAGGAGTAIGGLGAGGFFGSH